MQASASKIPVTIITGFLGSGKTTLLNNLIWEYRDALEDRENRIVFIGKDLPRKEIAEALESLMV